MLVPNLNEIMVEYGEDTEEAMAESMEKLPMEESIKKNGDEEGVEVGKEKKKENKGE